MQDVTFENISTALTYDYEKICCIGVVTGSYRLFVREKGAHDLICTKEGKDFWKDIKKYIIEKICEEYREDMIEIFDKSFFLRQLRNHNSYQYTYKVIKEGKGRYYNLKAITDYVGNTDIVFIGVTDVDAQMKRKKSDEEDRITYTSIAKALENRYINMFYVNIATGKYVEYNAKEHYKSLEIETGGEDFWAFFKKNIKRVVYREDQPFVRAAFQKDEILRHLYGDNIFTLRYRLLIDGKPKYVSLRATRVNGGTHLIAGITNIDDEVKREREFMDSLGADVYKSFRDELTCVKNKLSFDKYVETMDIELRKNQDMEFCIVVCDIIGTKKVNETKGKTMGDEHIKSGCMEICKIFDHSPVFRIGGDEFAIVSRGDDYENIDDLMDTLRSSSLANISTGIDVIASGAAVYEKDTDHFVTDVYEKAYNAMREEEKKLKEM